MRKLTFFWRENFVKFWIFHGKNRGQVPGRKIGLNRDLTPFSVFCYNFRMDGFNEYVGLLAAFMFALVTATGIIVLNRLLGPKHKSSPAKSEPFEGGVETRGPANRRLPVKFYLIAMLFILFDVEIV